MKILAINNNSFKGLFTDRSREKNVDWHMEYRPYSWELDKETQKPIMAKKQHVDVKEALLSDNEEIYTVAYGSEPAKSKDILGTLSYYRYPDHIMNGKMRSTITVAEPLNREESLKVYLNKMEIFRNEKATEQKILRNFSFDQVESNYNKFNAASLDYDNAYFSRRDEKNRMVYAANSMYNEAAKMYKLATAYLNMTETLEQTDKTIANMKAELKTIESAKKEGKVIDISVQSGENPNQALEAYIENKTFADVLNENFLIIFPAAALTFKQWIGKFYTPNSVFSKDQASFVNQIRNFAKACIKNSIK